MKLLAIYLTLFSSLSLAQTDLKVVKYRIKTGDTLSQVMEDHGIRGIYDNMLHDRHLNPMYILAINNGLKWEQLTVLPVGKVIYLPVRAIDKRSVASDDDDVTLDDISPKQLSQIIEEYVKERK